MFPRENLSLHYVSSFSFVKLFELTRGIILVTRYKLGSGDDSFLCGEDKLTLECEHQVDKFNILQ